MALTRAVRAYTGPECPRCGAWLDLDRLAAGEQRCSQCGGMFLATPFRPPELRERVESVAGAGPGGAVPCARHPGNASAGNCTRCGVFMCNLHGNRINHDILERKGSTYIARHGKDFMHANDPWFRGLSIMYGPDDTTLRPYACALPLKHLPTSTGIGAVAGIASAYRKSPRGCVRLITSVLLFGVLMPEMFFPLAPAAQPLIDV